MCQDGCSCQKAAIIFGVIWSSIAIVVSVTIAFSFSTVDINQIGLKYDIMSNDFDRSNIYLNGRHWVGLSSKMKVFDLEYQEIIFNPQNLGYIITKTSDPSEISLEIYIMYRLRPEFLLEIFKSYPDMDYQYSFNSIAKDAILDVAPTYSIGEYIKNRTAIGEAFLDSVNKAFRNIYIELVLFEMGEILFYNSYEEAIIENLKAQNDASVQNVENSLDFSQGNLDNLYSNMNLQINNILNQAKSSVNLLYNKFENQIYSEKLNSESKSYKQFMDSNTIGFSSKELTKFMLYNKIDYETFFDDEDNFSSNKTKPYVEPKLFTDYTYGGSSLILNR